MEDARKGIRKMSEPELKVEVFSYQDLGRKSACSYVAAIERLSTLKKYIGLFIPCLSSHLYNH